jgi:hypothetical protein
VKIEKMEKIYPTVNILGEYDEVSLPVRAPHYLGPDGDIYVLKTMIQENRQLAVVIDVFISSKYLERVGEETVRKQLNNDGFWIGSYGERIVRPR